MTIKLRKPPMKKLLHERLREIAPRISKSGGDDWGIDELREVMNVACYSTYQSDLKNTVLALADEIEKYYIPRPRFEDGEPVQRTDKVDWENFRDYHPQSPWMITAIRNDGTPIATAGDKVVAVAKITDDGFVKRHEPKVVDAEGAPCKKGETVWYTQGYTTKDNKGPWKVLEIQGCDSVLIGRGYLPSEDDYMETVSGEAPDILTHCEPDSLEKLRNDMAEYKTDTHFANLKTEHTLGEFIDRLTAIMERDA